MDNVEKFRVMLDHWIAHNKGHVEEFEKWRGVLQAEGHDALATHIVKAIALMAEMNAELGKALHEAGGSTGGHHHHGHHHHH